jgi:hypothetical protein
MRPDVSRPTLWIRSRRHRALVAEVSEAMKPDTPPPSAPEPRFRIWVLPCPFKKDGTPSLGTFGSSVRNVVILPVETWTQLCRENPALASTKFEVGSYE